MTQFGVIGTFIRVGDHELMFVAQAAIAGLSQSCLLVSDSKPQFTDADATTSAFSFKGVEGVHGVKFVEAEVMEDHVNGDLRYLYRPVKIHKSMVVQRRHPIKQPCWRRGRWKSLT